MSVGHLGRVRRPCRRAAMTANATVSAVFRGLEGARLRQVEDLSCNMASIPVRGRQRRAAARTVRRMIILDMVRRVGPAQGRARGPGCPICRAGSLSGAPPAACSARHSKEACCCSGCSGQAGAPTLQDVAAGSRSRLANGRTAHPPVRVAPAKPQSVSLRHHHAAASLAPDGPALKGFARTVGSEIESPCRHK